MDARGRHIIWKEIIPSVFGFEGTILSIILDSSMVEHCMTCNRKRASQGTEKLNRISIRNSLILDSSMVEHSAVNRVVVGSSPTRGVKESL